MKQRFLLIAVFGVVAALVYPGAAQACAVCLTGIAGDDPLTDAFNWSVLFLMAMPYTVVGSIAGWLFYTHWRTAAKRAGERNKAPVLHLAWTHKESEK